MSDPLTAISEDNSSDELCEHKECKCCCPLCNGYEPSEPENIEDLIAKGWTIHANNSPMKEGYTYKLVRVKL